MISVSVKEQLLHLEINHLLKLSRKSESPSRKENKNGKDGSGET